VPPVTDVPLSKVTILNSITDSKTGDLLQISSCCLPRGPGLKSGQNAPLVVLRAKFIMLPRPGNVVGIVILEGDETGIFISDAELNLGPAALINEYAEIAFNSLAPEPEIFGFPDRGHACLVSFSGDVMSKSMAVQWVRGATETINGYAGLDAPHAGFVASLERKQRIGTLRVIRRSALGST
jgi:hypothetical protein